MTGLNKKLLINCAVLGIVFLAFAGGSFGQGANAEPSAKALVEQGDTAFKKKDYDAAIALYKQAVELDPAREQPYSNIFSAYRSKVIGKLQDLPEGAGKSKVAQIEYGKMTDDLEKSFAQWNGKFPNNKVLTFYYAQVYQNNNREKQEQLLLDTLKLDPSYFPAYERLSLIEEVRGDNVKASEYLKKAADENPQNPYAAYLYAISLKYINPKLYRLKALEVAEKFPDDQRGAQSLYWLADFTNDQKEKIAILEKLRAKFPPNQSNWSLNSLPVLFKVYQTADPAKALEFAKDMVNNLSEAAAKKKWQDKVDFQQNFIGAQNLIAEKKYGEALNLLEKIKPQGAFSLTDVYILKAKALDLSGQSTNAYNELLKHYLDEPTDSLRIALENTGKKVGKNQAQITLDVNRQLDAKAQPQKDLSFVRYDNGKTVSLSDYRGKVILLSFWYPFCGPCRGEAPALQRILEKYKDRFVILSPNVHPEEDAFVLPYLKGNKYSFIPLKSNVEFVESEFKSTSFPTNLLIDRQGRIVFRENSAVRGESERALELQIEMLSKLEKN